MFLLKYRVLTFLCSVTLFSSAAYTCTERVDPVIVWIFGNPCRSEIIIVLHNYSTFGSTQGSYCSCALNLPTSLGAIISADLVFSGTSTSVPGFSFSPNTVAATGFNDASPLTVPEIWTGFTSEITMSVPQGMPVDLVFRVYPNPSIACREVTSQMAAFFRGTGGGVLVGTASAEMSGFPVHHLEIQPAGEVAVNCPADCGNNYVDLRALVELVNDFGSNTEVCEVTNDATLDISDLRSFLPCWLRGPVPK